MSSHHSALNDSVSQEPIARVESRTSESRIETRLIDFGEGRDKNGTTLAEMRAYTLAEIGDPHAFDVFLRREEAFTAVGEILNDEPEWTTVLYVVPIDSTSGTCR